MSTRNHPRQHDNGPPPSPNPYPAIGDYALISDCHSMALVSRTASIDWCCMPRVDSGSVFGRLLDWQKGGFCSIQPVDNNEVSHREYLPDTMVLATTFNCGGGEARVVDSFSMRVGGREAPLQELVRVVEGIRGRVEFELRVVIRFDYGELRPWLKKVGPRVFAALGGNDGLLIRCDHELEVADGHELSCRFTVHADQKVRLAISYEKPENLDLGSPQPLGEGGIDAHLAATIEWWRRWLARTHFEGADRAAGLRSAMVLKALTNAPTGAMAAAATTSLPERLGGDRNWDYRYSWIRDSAFSVRTLADIGADREADGFRRFIQRSAAGSAHDLQIMYGVGGERRLTEVVLDSLEGYRGSRPVRIGNGAARQLQLDAFGELVDLSWRWHRRGSSPDDDYWRFLLELVDVACERWLEPDRGLWEIRGPDRHFVHSKVMCWQAVDRGIALAEECLRQAPLPKWRKTATAIRESIETDGFDSRRNAFVQSYGAEALDSALLLIPGTGFCAYDDPRMVGTVRAIREDLEEEGLLLRYRTAQAGDGLGDQPEGYFIPCTFWLAECLARQGQLEAAREAFDRAASTSNDLGLFSEEIEAGTGEMLGNFPQALSHLSHLAAAVALAETIAGT